MIMNVKFWADARHFLALFAPEPRQPQHSQYSQYLHTHVPYIDGVNKSITMYSVLLGQRQDPTP